MSYEKDMFLKYAHDACMDCHVWEHDTEERWKSGISLITQRFEQSSELDQYMICQTVFDFANCAVVDGRLLRGKWRQLTGLLELYRDGRITDIGVSAHITRNTLGKHGAPTSGISMFIHDRGEGRIEIETNDAELREEVKNMLEMIDADQPRWGYFKAIEQAFYERNTEEIEHGIELDTYLFLNGEADKTLLEHSPNSFATENPYDDMHTHPEEYQHIQSLLGELSMAQLKHLLVYCGLKTDEEVQHLIDADLKDGSGKPMIRANLEYNIWYADREDFYREYENLTRESS